jgi:hypothetical protein
MIIYPPLRLSAQDEIKIDESVRMHKGVIEKAGIGESDLLLSLDGEESVSVTLTASTTIFLGNGEEGGQSALNPGTHVYVFGYYDSEQRAIEAEKIVIRNRRITERTAPSRAELDKMNQRQMLSKINPLELLGSISR